MQSDYKDYNACTVSHAMTINIKHSELFEKNEVLRKELDIHDHTTYG